jgi:hypothetical protein
MHDELWAGVDLKAGHADYFLRQMSKVIEPPEQTAWTVALQSSGAIIGNLWQQPFYANFDAFLGAARSIPEIIQCCFGRDRSLQMKSWFASRDQAEQDRRKKFSDEFNPDYSTFIGHPLTNARNITFHRKGYTSVEVKITSHFGLVYTGSPTHSVPIAVSPPNHPGPPFRQISLPLEPKWTDFTIDGKPLFEECRAYLDFAGELRTKAADICQRVHGNESLSIPNV